MEFYSRCLPTQDAIISVLLLKNLMKNKAKISEIEIGTLKMRGIMLPDSSFGVLISQVAQLLMLSPKIAPRSIHRLLGKRKPFLTTKIEGDKTERDLNYLTLSEFESVVAKLDRTGNKAAQDFRDLLIGKTLYELWSSAFGVKGVSNSQKTTVQQHEQRLQSYFPQLTKWLKADGTDISKDFNKITDYFKACANLPIKPVPQYEIGDLMRLNTAEERYDTLRLFGLKHHGAIKFLR